MINGMNSRRRQYPAPTKTLDITWMTAVDTISVSPYTARKYATLNYAAIPIQRVAAPMPYRQRGHSVQCSRGLHGGRPVTTGAAKECGLSGV
jgi:hypothetical protein